MAPSVSITAPVANAQFTQGDNVTITANASDSDGTITKVDFFSGSTLLGTDTTSPYSFATATLAVGSQSLTARATDDKGTTTVSAPVSINVIEKAKTAQVESFTLINAGATKDMFNLTNGMQIEGSIVKNLKLNIRANTNPSVVGSVYFTLIGPVKLTRTENAAPYALNGDYNGVYFGVSLPFGTYTLTAVTYSGSNRAGTKGPVQMITFSILDTPIVAPTTVNITAPAASAEFTQGASLMITANAAYSEGAITKVDFYNGSTLLGTDTTSPYSFETATLPAGSYSLTAKATDNNGTATVSAPVSIIVVNQGFKVTALPSEGGRTLITQSAKDTDVEIISPVNNSTLVKNSTISIIATAVSVVSEVQKIEYFRDDVLIGSSTNFPYEFKWVNVGEGVYQIKVKAYFENGDTKFSELTKIIVK